MTAYHSLALVNNKSLPEHALAGIVVQHSSPWFRSLRVCVPHCKVRACVRVSVYESARASVCVPGYGSELVCVRACLRACVRICLRIGVPLYMRWRVRSYPDFLSSGISRKEDIDGATRKLCFFLAVFAASYAECFRGVRHQVRIILWKMIRLSNL